MQDGMLRRSTTKFLAAQIALALLAALAISLVLITPDPTDDVIGILNGSHLHRIQKLTFSFTIPQAQQCLVLGLLAPPNSHQRLSTLELFHLVCVRRC